MIDLPLYLGFIAATSLLILIPGPNVSLIVANSLAHGTRYGLLTVAGTTAAILVQLALTVCGMTAVLESLAGWFEIIRWAGVAYLIVLGIRAWRAAPLVLGDSAPQPRAIRTIALKGFLISLTNPKTLLFYGAFFPQFVASDRPVGPQLALLSVTFVVIAGGLDGAWARRVLSLRARLRNRLTGGLLIGAGLGLALAHRR
jgi:threonine/homoserine/homoserine lactone efflux protein